jgi:hypothetical protein
MRQRMTAAGVDVPYRAGGGAVTTLTAPRIGNAAVYVADTLRLGRRELLRLWLSRERGGDSVNVANFTTPRHRLGPQGGTGWYLLDTTAASANADGLVLQTRSHDVHPTATISATVKRWLAWWKITLNWQRRMRRGSTQWQIVVFNGSQTRTVGRELTPTRSAHARGVCRERSSHRDGEMKRPGLLRAGRRSVGQSRTYDDRHPWRWGRTCGAGRPTCRSRGSSGACAHCGRSALPAQDGTGDFPVGGNGRERSHVAIRPDGDQAAGESVDGIAPSRAGIRVDFLVISDRTASLTPTAIPSLTTIISDAFQTPPVLSKT